MDTMRIKQLAGLGETAKLSPRNQIEWTLKAAAGELRTAASDLDKAWKAGDPEYAGRALEQIEAVVLMLKNVRKARGQQP